MKECNCISNEEIIMNLCSIESIADELNELMNDLNEYGDFLSDALKLEFKGGNDLACKKIDYILEYVDSSIKTLTKED